jgi:D-alanine-D-alanine ligase
MKKTVAIIFGGISPEHEVSVSSARSVFHAIDQSKYHVLLIGISKNGKWNVCTEEDLLNSPVVSEKKERLSMFFAEEKPGILLGDTFLPIDCVFPVLHGCGGEDGTIQGLFDIAEIPFVGCDMESSVLCMNKTLTKTVLKEANILQTPHFVLFEDDWVTKKITANTIETIFSYPLFIKPAHGGSSVGISKAHDLLEMVNAITFAFQYDKELVLEKFIKGRELECSVLGTTENQEASGAGEIKPKREFYDYEAKYLEDSTELIIPAILDESILTNLQVIAKKAFKILRGYGMARVDFFLEENTNNLYLNEINTIPGFTAISLYPKLWEAEGLSYKELVDRLIDLAFARKPMRKRMLKGV